MNSKLKGQLAVVIGGSMAGLMTTRVLANHFERVLLIEKDAFPEAVAPRKGVPQSRHLHALLAGGRAVLERYFPGLTSELVAAGAQTGDMGLLTRWYQYGGYKKPFKSELQGLLMSRPLLETYVRNRTLVLPNVTVREQTGVTALLTHPDQRRVTGVRLESRSDDAPPKDVAADLVVDASGRGSAAPRWLTAIGYEKPVEREVTINVGYATRIYRRTPDHLPGAALTITLPEPPFDKRGGFLFPIEGDRWIVTLPGLLHDYCPGDEAGFLAFARSLCAPDIYNVISRAEPLSDIMTARFPASLRRHYEKLRRFPERFLVLGDAVCSFNPIYGQGMTSATLQAQVLDHLLRQRATLDGLWKPQFRAAAKIVDIPWQLATNEDFRYPETQGERPPGVTLLNRYVGAVHRAVHHDPVVYKAFLEVVNLLRPPQALMRPSVLLRVLMGAYRQPRPSGVSPVTPR